MILLFTTGMTSSNC